MTSESPTPPASATIVPDGGGFRCSACKGGVRRKATSCKHCGAIFTSTAVAQNPTYDKYDQFRQLQEVLILGEQIEAVFDCKGAGAGFIGITTKRIVFHDKQFLRKLKAVVSIPYSRIKRSWAADWAWIFREQQEFEFRGADKAQIAHNLILAHMVD